METIKKDVQRLVAHLGLTADTGALFDVWQKEAGTLCRGCTDVALRGTILYITVTAPVYSQEIALRKRDLVRKINGHFSTKMITDIRCVLAPIV